MNAGYTIVGQRGQITIPKEIRTKLNIKEKDKLLVTLKSNDVIVKKIVSDDTTNKLMIEGYKKMSEIDKKTMKDYKNVDSEIDLLGDY